MASSAVSSVCGGKGLVDPDLGVTLARLVTWPLRVTSGLGAPIFSYEKKATVIQMGRFKPA